MAQHLLSREDLCPLGHHWPSFLSSGTLKSTVTLTLPHHVCFFLKTVPNRSKCGARCHLNLPQITKESRLFHKDAVVNADVSRSKTPTLICLLSNLWAPYSLSPSSVVKTLSSNSEMSQFSRFLVHYILSCQLDRS